MRAWDVVAWGLVGLVAAGCDDAAVQGAACVRDAECPAGQVCDTPGGEGHCVTASATRPALDEVSVPAGAFTMGCDPGADAACEDTEAPPHEVTVPAFRVDRTEVTVAAYAAFLTAVEGSCTGGPCLNAFGALPVDETEPGQWAANPGAARHPMTQVTWHGAAAYCAWRGQALCTEAQWERAARGDGARTYPWGDEAPSCERALMDAGEPGCGAGGVEDVGTRAAGASPFGALDMAGGVWEWVEDRWHDGYAGAPTDGSAWTEDGVGKDLRVIRGGGWRSGAEFLRAAHRWNGGAGDANEVRGFRCCRVD